MKQALTDVITDRLKNAFLANFILSWIVVNHSIIFYIFLSQDSSNLKLEYLKNLNFHWISDFLYPLILVFGYVYLLPLINLGLMKIKLKYIEPLLSNYNSDEQGLHYDGKISIEDKRLDLIFREKEREIALEEKRTKEQILRTKAAEEEAIYFSDKKVSEEISLRLEKEKLIELEKVVKLQDIISKQHSLDEREAMLYQEKERLNHISFMYDMNRHQAQWVSVNEAISEGDRVIINFVGSISGVEFEGGKADGFSLDIGSNRMIPGFESGLIGHFSGEQITISVKFPEEYHAENLKGETALFSVKIIKVEKQMMPLNKVENLFKK